MEKRSPTLEGFRTIFRSPLFGFAELAWRWSFGAAAASLLAFLFIEFLDTLPVTRSEMFLLGTHQPSLIGQAIGQILRGSAPRFISALLVLTIGLAFVWVIVASLARKATVRALLAYFRKEEEESFAARGKLRPVISLNTLRLAATVAAFIGGLAAWIAAGAAGSSSNPSPGFAFIILVTILFCVGLAWSAINWFLSLATIFAARAETDVPGAISAAADFCAQRLGAVAAPGTWFGLTHGVAFCIATFAAFFLLSFAVVVPVGVLLGALISVTLAYFFVADFLYMGRLVAYIFAIEGLDAKPVPPVAPPSPPVDSPPVSTPPVSSPPEPARVDPDEVILSDFPIDFPSPPR